jgi:hypothetical protein
MNRLMSPVHLARTALALLVLIGPTNVRAAQAEITPLKPDERAFGLTLGEWGAAWVQWLYSIPASTNPRNEKTGMGASVGQRMPVWFLPPAFGSPDPRTIIVPAGYSILYVGPTTLLIHMPPPIYPKSPDGLPLPEALQKMIESVSVVEVSVDGVLIPDAKRYGVQSPLFTLFLPPGSIEDPSATEARRDGALIGGYFYLLPPLPVGKHVIQARWEGVNVFDGTPYKFEAPSVNLIVANPNEPLP